MNRKSILAWFLIVLAAFGCKKPPDDIDPVDMTSISTLQNINGKEIIIEIVKGDNWEYTYKKGVWPVKVAPQFVIWSEDSNGSFIDTIYVTHKFGKQLWRNAPDQDAQNTFRKESLPHWLHKRTKAGFVPPTRIMPLPDTITSATPVKNSVFYTKVPDYLEKVRIKIEINLPHDGNTGFPDDAGEEKTRYTGVSGQPALVYGADVDLKKPGKYEMKLLGHSSPSGKDGELFKDVSGVTSAKRIIKNIYIIFPGE